MQNGQPIFDGKYPTIIKTDYTHNYLEMLEWVNSHSDGSVDVKFNNTYGQEAIYFGFENADDATFFKIKYIV